MQIQLRVPQDRELLPSLFVAIDEALARAGIAPSLANDIRLVSEEVVCNALAHGRPAGAGHEVTVEMSVREDRVLLCFRDDGAPFDPLEHPPPDLECDLEERRIGGLGVHLIRTLADEIAYVREGRHNILHVVLMRAPAKDRIPRLEFAMNITIHIDPPSAGSQRVAVGGRLDTHTYSELDRQLAPVLASGTPSVVLDLAQLEYISSAGIRSILLARKSLASRGGKVLVVNPQPQIQKVFDVVKAVPLNEIFTSIAEADAYLDHMQRKVLSGDQDDEG